MRDQLQIARYVFVVRIFVREYESVCGVCVRERRAVRRWYRCTRVRDLDVSYADSRYGEQ